MANNRTRNSIYIDTVATISLDTVKPLIMGILITPSAANSRVVIKESSGGMVVIDAKIEAIESRFIDFSSFGGIEVTATIDVATLTNITTVMLFGNWLPPIGSAI